MPKINKKLLDMLYEERYRVENEFRQFETMALGNQIPMSHYQERVRSHRNFIDNLLKEIIEGE